MLLHSVITDSEIESVAALAARLHGVPYSSNEDVAVVSKDDPYLLLHSSIMDLARDAQVELCALALIGRGDFTEFQFAMDFADRLGSSEIAGYLTRLGYDLKSALERGRHRTVEDPAA